LKTLHFDAPFALESGAVLPSLDIAYHTFGRLNPSGNNVIWVFHAFTGNSDVADWWPGLFGAGKLLDPERYFIVCANMLGSCYGATNARSIHPETGRPYGRDFPLITIRDMVRSHQILQKHLGIKKIRLGIGGSMGGQQLVEWLIMDPELFEKSCLIATNARHSAWGIAFNEAQRMAIEADPTLYDETPGAGRKGLESARAVAMLSYRNYHTYEATQSDPAEDKKEAFRACSYQRYQGLKLSQRFDPLAYVSLSKAMDSHHVGRGRGGAGAALRRITTPTLVIGIQSDVLFPVEEQLFLAKHIPNAQLEIIESKYGHDGFLVESAQIGRLVSEFLNQPGTATPTAHYSETWQNGIRTFHKTALPGTETF